MSGWIAPPPVTARTEPHLVARADLGALRAYLAEHGAGVDDLDVSDVISAREIIDRLTDVLPFPGWTGANWDAVFDVTEELRAALTFPHALVIRGYDRLLSAHPHVALEFAIRMSDFSRELAFAKAQLVVYYEGEAWT